MGWKFPDIWKTPPRAFELGTQQVHLWIAAIPDCVPHLAEYHNTLSDEERQRAARFHFEPDRHRYAITRGILRKLLAAYTGQANIDFTCNPYGKPALTDQGSRLQFNVAHSRDLALFGFTRERDIGVDVEWIRPDFATTEIAQRFFAPDEAAAVTALPQPERALGFFNCWTRKEAYIKARGMGLSLVLHSFAVTLLPKEPAGLVRVDGDPSAPERWTMLNLEVGPEYRAATAFEARNLQVSCWRWGTNPT